MMTAPATLLTPPIGTHARDEQRVSRAVRLLIPGRPQSRLDTESGAAWFAAVKHHALVTLEQLGALPLIPTAALELTISTHYACATNDNGNIPRVDKLEPTLSALNGILYSSAAQITKLSVQRFIQDPNQLAGMYGLECRRGLLIVRWDDGAR